MALGEDLIRD